MLKLGDSRGMANGRPKPAGEWGMLRFHDGLIEIQQKGGRINNNIHDSWLKNEINFSGMQQ